MMRALPGVRSARRSGMRTGAAVLCAAASLTLSPRHSPLHAQDVEARSWLSGRALPQAYFDRIRQDPTAFEIGHGWIARAATAAVTASAVQGQLPLLVIQVLFADSPEPHIASADVQRILFDGPAQWGTLSEYYREVSGGLLHVTGHVSPWVRTNVPRATAVGSSYGLGGDAQVGTFLLQALIAADPLVDYGAFDNDGPDGVPNSGDDDGFVDAVAFQFIERAANCPGEAIWPHRSRISGWGAQTGSSPYVTAELRPNGQPVRVNDYIIQSTVQCDGVNPLSASVIAHELGHVLGLPDLYHAANGILPEQRRWVIGCWSLMSAGSWGCGSSTQYGLLRPTHLGAWEKHQLGWIQPEVVGAVREHEYTLDPVQTSGQTLRVPLTAGEYLHIEYRPRIGFDVNLPASGVLIYHIEPGRPLYPAVNGPRIYRIALEEADGDSALVKTAQEGGNRGMPGDAWATAGSVAFSNITHPSTRLNSGQPSTVTIHSIHIENGRAVIHLTNAPIPVIIGDAQPVSSALTGFSTQLRANGGALPYTWSVIGNLPSGITLTPNGEQVTLGGTPLEPGAFDVQLQVRDARGSTTTQPLSLRVTPVNIASVRALQPFTRSAAQPLSTDELRYLDLAGNRNGRYDVGDLRRHLKAQGEL